MIDRKQLIDMAHRCGAVGVYNDPNPGDLYITIDAEVLERFAALVAAHEREQCALIAETIVSTATQGTVIADCLGDVAAAIRARGEISQNG